MLLSKSAIEKFKSIYLNDYGVDLSYKEAEAIANSYFNQMKIIYRPIPKECKVGNFANPYKHRVRK